MVSKTVVEMDRPGAVGYLHRTLPDFPLLPAANPASKAWLSGIVKQQPQFVADAELDRRVRALEEGLSDRQARVERLETSTH